MVTSRSAPLGPLAGSTVVLGVSGGIAAYKAVEVCRLLVEAGAHVVPVLTKGATRFVGAATFSALASEPAKTELFGDPNDPIPHTRLGQSADLVLVVPATARVIGEHAAGISADLLGATLLATRAPVLFCPAMHTEMWEHPAVQENLATLRRRGVTVLEPDSGRLAGGDVGAGRLPSPAAIVAAAAEVLAAGRQQREQQQREQQQHGEPRHGEQQHGERDLAGTKVLVTAGGTREPIDPVRYLGNRSSGKQGHALAEVALARGATVILVTTSPLPVAVGIEVLVVETAAEMREAVLSRAEAADVVVMTAAVADFRPRDVAPLKLRKSEGAPEIVLEPTGDILAELGRRRRPGQVLVGFAAETDNVERRAAEKLASKGLDLIVVNDVSAPGVGFAHDTNAVVVLGDDGSRVCVPLGPKPTIARAVLDAVVARRVTVGGDSPTPGAVMPEAGRSGKGDVP